MAIYFISDHHFGERGEKKEKLYKFLEFMDYITRLPGVGPISPPPAVRRAGSQGGQKEKCEALFILGDLFDFYFEYKTQIPKAYFDILYALNSLKKSGVSIYYMVGNHDFWIGDFFAQKLGIKVYKKPISLMLQGKKVFIAHGDEFSSFDPLRFILRNKLSIFFFYWLHPDIARKIGRLVSRISRKSSSREKTKSQKLYKFGIQKFKEGFDAVIFGHIHSPEHLRYGNKDFLLLGDWIHHFSYGKLTNGKFKLCFW
ncbi:UDP-2,3-diacylglucosamine diphosphatase [candidate division WOR-3 bacterium]|nr:UDP-2,3-diacylglucosamine diphosphatase [candidate division WOR-3 bacterium]